jgi:DNA uptake protein ComE-like DNA-binding protein
MYQIFESTNHHTEEPRESAQTFEVKRNINAMSDSEILSLHGIPLSVLKAVVNFRNTLGSTILQFYVLKI